MCILSCGGGGGVGGGGGGGSVPGTSLLPFIHSGANPD